MISRKVIRAAGCKRLYDYFQTIVDKQILGQNALGDLTEMSKPQRVKFISWAQSELRTDRSNHSEQHYRDCIKLCESILRS